MNIKLREYSTSSCGVFYIKESTNQKNISTILDKKFKPKENETIIFSGEYIYSNKIMKDTFTHLGMGVYKEVRK